MLKKLSLNDFSIQGRYRDKEFRNGTSEQKFESGHFKSENFRLERFLIIKTLICIFSKDRQAQGPQLDTLCI